MNVVFTFLNVLPRFNVVDADAINTFNRRLDKHWLDQDVVCNFYAELTETGSVSICICCC